MYEFLAPWGVLAPVLCATASYFLAQNVRRKRQLSKIQAPESLALLLGSDMVLTDSF